MLNSCAASQLSTPIRHYILNLLVPACLYCLSACGPNEKKDLTEKQSCVDDGWYFEKAGDKYFSLDSLSSKNSTSYQYVSLKTDSGTHTFYTFLNQDDYSIYFYNYKTTDFVYKIRLQNEGPHAVPGMRGYTIKNLDTIALYGNSDVWRFNFVNHKGKKVFSFQDDPYQYNLIKYPPYTNVDGSKQLYFVNGKMISIGFNSLEFPDDNNENRKVITVFDFGKMKPEFFCGYPDIYNEGNWFGNFFRDAAYCFNKREQKLVVSFPGSNIITVLDLLTKEETTYNGGSCHLEAAVPSSDPFSDQHKLQSIQHFIDNDKYGGILYDEFNDCYYRIGIKGSKGGDMRDRASFLKEFYVIILDNKFKYKGEQRFEGKEYGVGGIAMVSPDGLLLAHFGDKNEDRSSFHIFKLIKR
jgi:hypothetical protein